MKLIYVSGPITPTDEYPDLEYNRERILKKCKELFNEGYAIYCPVQEWLTDPGHYDDLYERILKMDEEVLLHCDAIYMLKGWMYSRGAQREHQWCQKLDIEIMYEDDLSKS